VSSVAQINKVQQMLDEYGWIKSRLFEHPELEQRLIGVFLIEKTAQLYLFFASSGVPNGILESIFAGIP